MVGRSLANVPGVGSLYHMDVVSTLGRFNVKAGGPLAAAGCDMGQRTLDLSKVGLDVEEDKLTLSIYRNSTHHGYVFRMGGHVLSSLRVPTGVGAIDNSFLELLGPSLAAAEGAILEAEASDLGGGTLQKDAENNVIQGCGEVSEDMLHCAVPGSSLSVGASCLASSSVPCVGVSSVMAMSNDVSSGVVGTSSGGPVNRGVPSLGERLPLQVTASTSMSSVGSVDSSISNSSARLQDGTGFPGAGATFSSDGDEIISSLNENYGPVGATLNDPVVTECSAVLVGSSPSPSGRPLGVSPIIGLGHVAPQMSSTPLMSLAADGGPLWEGPRGAATEGSQAPLVTSTSRYMRMGEALDYLAAEGGVESGVEGLGNLQLFVPARRQLFAPVATPLPVIGELPVSSCCGEAAVHEPNGEMDFSLVPGGLKMEGSNYAASRGAAVQRPVTRDLMAAVKTDVPICDVEAFTPVGRVRPLFSDLDLPVPRVEQLVGAKDLVNTGRYSVGATRGGWSGVKGVSLMDVDLGERPLLQLGEKRVLESSRGVECVAGQKRLHMVGKGLQSLSEEERLITQQRGVVPETVVGSVSSRTPGVYYSTAEDLSVQLTVSAPQTVLSINSGVSSVSPLCASIESKGTCDYARRVHGLDGVVGYTSFSEGTKVTLKRQRDVEGCVPAKEGVVNTVHCKDPLSTRIPQLSSLPVGGLDMSFRPAACYIQCSHDAGSHFLSSDPETVRFKGRIVGRGLFCKPIVTTSL
jgi:hypothetical protein